MDLLLISSHPVMWGLASLVLNLGARHLHSSVTPQQDAVLASTAFQVLVVLSVFFMATRDLRMAALLTAGFWLTLRGVLNETSPLNVLVQKTMADDAHRQYEEGWRHKRQNSSDQSK